MFSVIFFLLNSRKGNHVLPQKNVSSNSILLWGQFPVSLRKKNVFLAVQWRFGGLGRLTGLSSLSQNWAAFLPLKQMDFEPEFLVSVGRTCGSSPWLLLKGR